MNSKLKFVTFVQVLVIFIFAGMSNVFANDKTEGKKHFKSGLALLETEDFKGAASEFEVSVNFYPTKNGLFNLANCYKALHKYGQSVEILTRLEKEFEGKLDEDWISEITGMRDEINLLVGELNVQVSLDGATVKVDGKEQGKSPIGQTFILGPGEHTVEVSFEGYKTEKRTIKIVSAGKSIESFKLEPLFAQFEVTANISDAEIYLDGKIMGVTPLTSPVEVKPGKHELQLKKKGYDTAKQTVELKPGEKSSYNFSLQEKKPEPQKALLSDTKVAPIQPEDNGGYGLFWSGFTGAVVTGVLSGTFWGVGHKKNADYKDLSSEYEENSSSYSPDQEEDKFSEMEDARGKADLFRKMAIGSTIAAGVFGLMAAIGLFTGGGESEDPNSVKVSAAPGGLKINF